MEGIQQDADASLHASESQNSDDGESTPTSVSDEGPSNERSGELQTPRNSKDKFLHVSVHRSEISSATVREGDHELEGLGVEVYDQQTYEEGVFEQVNNALSAADRVAHGENNVVELDESPANINNLIRLIHDQNTNTEQVQVKEEVPLDPSDRDEQILQLARAERLNRRPVIKLEPPGPLSEVETLAKLPRVPRLSKSQVDVQPSNELNVSRSSSCRSERHEPKKTGILTSGIRLEYHEYDDCDDSDDVASEYRPTGGEPDLSDDDYDDVDFETEGEQEADEDQEVRPSRKKVKMGDDGDFQCYQARVKAYIKERAKMRLNNILEDGTEIKKLDEMVEIEGDLRIPKEMWDNLFEHQKTGVRWLWELHQLGTGGILGDEMGLGKTIQMIAFLTALKCSNVRSSHNGYGSLGPTVLVCPATVMHQWLSEFRKWWPQFRVAILHNTGTFSGDRKQLVNVIHKSKGVLIVSYPGAVIYQDHLHNLDWHYAILDEGHKIRNPDAQVTLACKRFRTPHRIILSGSPVQNNLKELWSIFDFIYPGKLGTLPVFMGQFGIPITQGGYANATDIQVQIAYKCACVLRDTIKPFLLRRTKAEVNNKLKLPDRSEQVLFCKLTEPQRKLYEVYLESPTVRDIKRACAKYLLVSYNYERFATTQTYTIPGIVRTN